MQSRIGLSTLGLGSPGKVLYFLEEMTAELNHKEGEHIHQAGPALMGEIDNDGEDPASSP